MGFRCCSAFLHLFRCHFRYFHVLLTNSWNLLKHQFGSSIPNLPKQASQEAEAERRESAGAGHYMFPACSLLGTAAMSAGVFQQWQNIDLAGAAAPSFCKYTTLITAYGFLHWKKTSLHNSKWAPCLVARCQKDNTEELLATDSLSVAIRRPAALTFHTPEWQPDRVCCGKPVVGSDAKDLKNTAFSLQTASTKRCWMVNVAG